MKKIILLFSLCVGIGLNSAKSQSTFYFWPCQGSAANTGNSCSTPNYTAVADVTAGPGFTGINPGCFDMSYVATINGGIYTNQNGSTSSPYSPVYTNIPATYGHRISVNFTASDPANNNATVVYSFTEGGTARNLPISFDIFDINTGSYALTNSVADKALNFIDVVKVTARTASGVVVNPTFATQCGTPTDEVTGGNTIKGNQSCPSSTTIDVRVTFSVQVSEITLLYTPGTGYAGNVPLASASYSTGWPQAATDNPGRQYIDISPLRIGAGASLSAPTSITGTSGICSGNSTTLTATGGTGTTKWYTGSCGGTSIGTGTSIVVSPTTTTNYYAANINCNVATACASVAVTVTTTPTANAGSASSVLNCTNTSVSLSGSGGGGYSWTGPAGGISSGAASATPTVTRSGTYSLTVNSGACNSAISTVAVTQNTTAPAVTTSTTQITCVTTTANVGLATGATSPTYTWSGTGITSAANISTITVNQAGTFNYSVTSGANGCLRAGSLVVSTNTITPTISSTSAGTLTCTNTVVATGVVSPTSPISFNWSGPSITSGVSSTSVSVNQPGTYDYTVTNTANGCKTTGTTSVTQNTVAPDVSSSVTNSITCSITTASVIASTISTPVSYTWTGPGITVGANSPTATVNAGGTYNYSVTNTANGCRSVGSVSVTQNTPTFTVSSMATSTLNCVTTTATISATTTESPVSYAWSGPGISSGNGSSAITATVGGTYNYTATNTSNGCSTLGSYTLTQNISPTLITSTSSTTLTCNTNTAQAIVVPTNTSTTISWDGPSIFSGANTGTVIVNGPGVYTYTVTKNNNLCTAINTVSVLSNTTAPATSATASTTLTCTNSTITLNGGPASGVTYAWSGPSLAGATNTANASANAPGDYTLVTTSSVNGCTNSAVASVTQNTAAPTTTISPSSFSTTCASPTVQISASGVGLTYVWTPPTSGSLNNNTISNPIANGSGVFTVVATSTVNGCSSTVATATVVADAAAPSVTLSTSSTTLTCLAAVQSVTASLSPGPFSYSWSPNPASGAGTGTVTLTNPGTYSVTVTNTSNNCTTNAFVTVSQNTVTPMVSASAPSSITCLTTSVQAVASTTTPASYNWSGPGILSGGATASVTVNTGGAYNYTVTNTSTGCLSTGSVTVSSNTTIPTLTLTPASFTTTCASPTVQINASGTPASLTYTWASPATGSLSDNSIANPIASGSGVFTVVATNSVNGCATANGAYTATVVADAGLPVVTLSTPSLTLNCTSAVQSVTANVSIGTVSYSWSPMPSSGVGTGTVSFDSPGTYTLVVTNTSNSCPTTTFVSVNQNTVIPVFTAIADQTLTCANPITSLVAAASPSTGTTYNWFGSGIVSGGNTDIATINAGGIYTVIAIAANGCTTSATASVTDNNTPITGSVTPSSSLINITCTNSVVALSAAATPTNDIIFVWSTGGSSANENVNLPGVVTVTLVNSVTGCSTTAQFAVTQNTLAPNVTFANTTFPCGPLTSTVNASSTSTSVSYNWSGAGVVSGASSSSPEINTPGLYSVTVTDNTTGCSTATTVVVGLATINASFTPSSNFGEAPAVISFSNQSTGATTYAWNFDDGGTSTATNPDYTFNAQGSYTVILTASNGLCIDTAATVIIIDEGFDVYIPNVFTPNGDGANDLFYIKAKGIKNLQGDIFNRWGQLLYTMTGINSFWDGKAPNSELVPDGTYFYILNITTNKNEQKIYKGTVNLYR